MTERGRRQEPARLPTRHSCAGRNGGWEATSVHQRSSPRFPLPLRNSRVPTPRHSYAPFRHSCAGRNRAHPNAHNQHAPSHAPKKMHPSPLLGGRLGGGWEATSIHQRSRPRPPPPHAPPPLPCNSVIPAQAGTRALPAHSCLRRNDGKGDRAATRPLAPTRYLPPHSCLRRNDGIGRRNDGGGRRDELGKGRGGWWGGGCDGLGRTGSCLRRNDG